MPVTHSLELWQEGELDPGSGLPFRRSTIIPDGYTAFTKKKRHPLGRLGTFLRGLRSRYRSRRRQSDTTSSEQTAEQQSSFRRSLVASALLEKELASFKPPNKLAHVLSGSTVPNQVVWRQERSPLTEGHPALRANPDIHIPTENDKAIHWTLNQMFSPNDSRISLVRSLGQ